MRTIIFFTFLLLQSISSVSQSRLVIADDANIVITNGAYLVVDNGSSNAITTTGSGGNIISENEFNFLKWNIDSNTGVFSVPFSKTITEKIPVSVTIVNGGSTGGSLLFSTYGGSGWDNSAYMPSGVTHMNNLSGFNNSAYVIDRFWIIDPINFTSKPEGSISLTYIDAEWSQIGNTITESSFLAQRFNPAPMNLWGDWMGPAGTSNTITNTVNTGFIFSSNFFRNWTLADEASPLPIELVEFTVNCLPESNRLVQWTTMSEIQNQYFIIQSSQDGLTWEKIAQVDGAGTTTTLNRYEQIVSVGTNYNYFRLMQIDFDGLYTYSNIVHNACTDSDIPLVSIYPNPNNGIFSFTISGNPNFDDFTIEIFNSIGQKIQVSTTKNGRHLMLDITKFPNGIYFLNVIESGNLFKSKVVKTF